MLSSLYIISTKFSTRGGPPRCWCAWKSCPEECLKDESRPFQHGREMGFSSVTSWCGLKDCRWKLQRDRERQAAQFKTKQQKPEEFPTELSIDWADSLSK